MLVLYRQSLFTQGLQRMLESAGDFEVSGIDLDFEDPIAALRANNPDAVVIDVSDLCAARKELLLALLGESPSLQIVCLTALDGRVNLFHHEQTPLTRGDDFLNAFRSV